MVEMTRSRMFFIAEVIAVIQQISQHEGFFSNLAITDRKLPTLIYLLKWPSINAFLGMGTSQSTLGNEITNAEVAPNPFKQKRIFGITTAKVQKKH